MKRTIGYHFLAVLFVVAGCGDKTSKFQLVPPSKSGIEFSNTLTESVDFNIFNYMYFYNGGGVAVGDLNADGLSDIFFYGKSTSG